MDLLDAISIPYNEALRMMALRDFEDVYGITRRKGQEYLITPDMTTSHIPYFSFLLVFLDNINILWMLMKN